MGPMQLSRIAEERMKAAYDALEEIRIFYSDMHGLSEVEGEKHILDFEKNLAIAEVAVDVMEERGYKEPRGRPGIDGYIEDLDIYTVSSLKNEIMAMRREVEMILDFAMKESPKVFWEKTPFSEKKISTMRRGYEYYKSGKAKRKDRSYDYD